MVVARYPASAELLYHLIKESGNSVLKRKYCGGKVEELMRHVEGWVGQS